MAAPFCSLMAARRPAPRFGYHAVNLFLVGVAWRCNKVIVIFRAFHVDIWIAFVGFFLPFVVAFTSRNAARFAFLETQDCIGHNPSSSFLRRVNCPLGDSGDGGDSSFGIPPHKSRHRHAAILLSEAARRRIAGRKTCHKGVQRERLAHDFAGQSVVCYTL